jgi:hypothetical protein
LACRPGTPFEEKVTVAKKPDQEPPDEVFLTHDNLAHVCHDTTYEDAVSFHPVRDFREACQRFRSGSSSILYHG